VSAPAALRPLAREALALLGVERLVLGIHDASFPSLPDDDTGRGTPCGTGGLALLRFAHGEGFDGVQLGPQGRTEPGNPSPYDGALFARDPLSISLARLADPHGPHGALLSRETLERLVAARPEGAERRVPHLHVTRAHAEALGEAFERFRAACETGRPFARRLEAELAAFRRRHARWLARDALAEALRRERPEFVASLDDESDPDQRLWAPRPGEEARALRRRRALARRQREALRAFAFEQILAHAHHGALREELAGLGLRLYGDLQIGISRWDAWSRRALLLCGYRLGAPPSRTNPEGQPWGYPVLDPEEVRPGGRRGPVLRFVAMRLDKAFAEFDGLRIDHPHGWVCPWVYRTNETDPLRAVQGGARLFDAPDLPDHPRLARFAIARRADLNPDPHTPRHADDWVVRISAEQEDRYAALFDEIPAAARRHGRSREDLVCEVLSTLPHPLARILDRFELGRFRVTQKASLDDPADVYRSENARPEDWILFGNHDTPTIWGLLEAWRRDGSLGRRAARLAERLVPEPARREAFAVRLGEDPGLLAHAHFAELFASPARHVMIFFADLFGVEEIYNRPGVIGPENWSLRLPQDWEREYRTKRSDGHALDLACVLALALGALREGGTRREALRRALETCRPASRHG
jgi:4-alpha-glucanotransferase